MSQATPLPLRERKKRDTRRRICDVASHLFVEDGFDSTTVEAIASESHISKPTFFNYFASKQQVLSELMTRMDEEFVRYIGHAVQEGRSTSERLSVLMKQSAEHIERHPKLTRLLLVEGMSDLGDPNVDTSRMARLNGAMSILVETGRAQGDIGTEFSTELQVQILVGGYLYGLLNWLSGTTRPLHSALQETADFLAEALAPRESE